MALRAGADDSGLSGQSILREIDAAGIRFVVSVPDITTSEGLLRPLAAYHHVNGHGAVSIGGEFERFQCMEAGKLLIDAGRRIEADHDARQP